MHMPTASYNQEARSAEGIASNMQTSALFLRKGNEVNMGKEK
jgi:hypothetical protein